MIELYAKGTTDFTKHGIALAATQASVTWQDSGRYDMDMVMPYNDKITIDYGMILRCPVPVQSVGAITLGTVSYWQISSGLTDVKLYKSVPVTSVLRYTNWYVNPWNAGDKVTFNNKNWQCTQDLREQAITANPFTGSPYWTEISRYRTTGGEVLNTLDAGDIVIKTGDFSSTYMKAADTSGNEGFIEIAKCTDMSETETRTVPAFTITEQSFTITEISKSSDKKMLSIHAEHISYQLGRVMLGDANISRATPATAIALIRGAMLENYPGAVETNLPDTQLITGDFSWKNAQSAILDPKAGLLANTTGWLIRNDLDVYVLEEGNTDAKYRIIYGTNMKAVKWTGDVGSLITRIYPIAQSVDGSTLLLPEKYIDTVRTVPYIRPEALKTGLKVGDKEKQEDGSEIELDETTVFTRMREQAANRFNIDECDKAEVTLEVDWQHLPDTAEYSQYAALANAAPGEWVLVVNGPLGINTTIQMTGYTYDPILKRYQKGTFGKKKTTSSVASYEIQSGAVTSRAIASGAVGSANMQAGSITAREIATNSLTSDLIAARSITTQLIMAGAITADEITSGAISTEKLAALAVTAEKIAAGAITSDKIDANSITTEKLAADAITADVIDANSIDAINAKLGIADVAKAEIAVADIDYAKVKDLNAQSAYFGEAVFQAAVGEKLFVPRLMVAYAQMVQATIGDLVIKATDGNYYHLDVTPTGAVNATQVSPTEEEIAQGHTNTGQTIIDTDIVADQLSASDIYATHALMGRITAEILNVDQLFAREATIAQLNVMDLTSNTYIQSMVDSRSKTYTGNEDPSLHYNLKVGDMWVKGVGFVNWEDIASKTWTQMAAYNWDELGSNATYVWNGTYWELFSDQRQQVLNEQRFESWTRTYQDADALISEAVKQSVSTEAPAFSTSTAYAIGDVVSYEGKLYKFTSAHSAGAWNPSHVTEVNVNEMYIAKTSTYQTAESIVTAANSYTSGQLANYSTQTQTANSITAAVGSVAPAFSTTKSYAVGDFVSYNGAVYKFTSAHSGAWNASHVTAATATGYTDAKAYAVQSGVTITSSGVDVSGSKHINLDVNSSNYVHINDSGIDMKGSRVSVNGKDMWARDDIIVLKSTDNETTVINNMSGHHDWVLIKPYYNAEIKYDYNNTYDSRASSTIVQLVQEGSGVSSFGTSATWYQYTISGTARVPSGETQGTGTFTCKLGNSSSSLPVSFTGSVAVYANPVDFSFNTGHISTNLCGDGTLLYLQLNSNYVRSVTNLKVTCTCDSTTSKVPCTVYYFP